MTSFTRTWNSAYEALPPNSDDARQGASRIRELKVDLRERMIVDHSWTDTVNSTDGFHKALTMMVQSTDPPVVASAGRLYVKMQGSVIQLYYRDSAGNIFPMTSSGGGAANIIPPGVVFLVANGVDADGTSYIQCDGRAVSRTTYAGLFFAISTGWGAGDGSTTFNVPDLRGRTVVGRGQGTGLSARTSGQYFGTETHVLTIQEIPGHQHAIAAEAGGTPGSVNGVMAPGVAPNQILTESAGGNAGTGIADPHQNMQPSAVMNYWIKT